MKKILNMTALLIAVCALSIYAVSGVAISLKGTSAGGLSGNVYGGGGFGATHASLWRHNITNSVATGHTEIFAGPAMNPQISPNGQWVAFIKKINTVGDGKVCLMSINGGRVYELADCNCESALEFPTNEWIYYTQGKVDTDGSRYLRRVNHSGVSEAVVTIDWGCCQFLISNDLTRAVIRTANWVGPLPTRGGSMTYNMLTGNGKTYVNFTGGCSLGMSSDGQQIFRSWDGHYGYYICNWNDSTPIASFKDSLFLTWPPNSQVFPAGTNYQDIQHNYWVSGFATNAPNWMCIALDNEAKTSPQYLVNWKTRQCIYVTAGQTGVFSAGDFWQDSIASASYMKLSKDSLYFETSGVTNPASQSVTITNGGALTLAAVTTAITYTTGTGWLTAKPSGSSGNTQTVALSINATGLAGGYYTARVRVTATGADPTDEWFLVKLKVALASVLTSVTVSPDNKWLKAGDTLRYSALAFDQYGVIASPPAFTWSASGGLNISSSGLLTASNIGNGGIYNIIATATVGGVTKSDTAQVRIARQIPGLNYSYYEGSWNALPDFATLTPVRTGVVSTFDFAAASGGDTENYGLVFGGFIKITTAGQYTFTVNCDDESKLYINNQEILRAHWSSNPKNVTGQVTLTAGIHAIKLTFYQGDGGNELSVNWAGPGIPTQAIPTSVLFATNSAASASSPELFSRMLTLRCGSVAVADKVISGTGVSFATDYLKPDSLAAPGESDTITINNKKYTWTKITEADGVWNEEYFRSGLNYVSYMSVVVVSPASQDVILKLCFDTNTKVWLRGSMVYERTSNFAVDAETSIPIHLNQGANRLLFKTGSGEWQCMFSARLTDLAGVALPGLEYTYERGLGMSSDNLLTIAAPVAGATYTIGDTITTRWNIVANRITGVLIAELSIDNGRTWLGISGPINEGDAAFYSGTTGTHKWKITPTVTKDNTVRNVGGAQCKIRIMAYYDPALLQAATGAFTIVNPSIGVIDKMRFYTANRPIKYYNRMLYVSVPHNGASVVRIENLQGQQILNKTVTGDVAISVRSLSSGIYLARVISAAKTVTYKFMVN